MSTPSITLALYQPEIPPNTGNLIRLCANCLVPLHLIKPLGFSLDEKALRRAGLDYHEWTELTLHDSFSDFLNVFPQDKLYAISTKGRTYYHEAAFKSGDILLFGPETRGLPESFLNQLPEKQVLRLPMQAHSRSLNLSNAAAIVVYEALRQLGFKGLS